MSLIHDLVRRFQTRQGKCPECGTPTPRSEFCSEEHAMEFSDRQIY